MIPFWVRWVEVAQFFEGSHAGDLQDWLADHGIYARINTHRQEQTGVGTSGGDQVLPDRAPVAQRYSVEVLREDLELAQEALRASGWQTTAYEGREWLSQSLTVAGTGITIVIVAALVVLLRILGER